MIMRSKILRAAMFAVTIGTAGALAAAAPPINYSDQWSNAAEPGWGVSITQQADILFGALYIHDSGQLSTWYTATMRFASENGNARTYTGTLYRTTGSALGQPYNPALVQNIPVGTMTMEFGDDAHAILTYSVDGISVTKAVDRLTFATSQFTGGYIGATSDVTYDCANPARNGAVTTDPGAFSIAVENGEVVMRFPTCTVNGKYTQQGQIGQIEGTYGCTHGGNGTIKFTGIRSEKGGIVGNYVGRDDFSCSFRGNLGGMRNLE